jgi:hypothetical protein
MGRLITLPLRLGVGAASLMLRGTEAVLTRALALAGRTDTAAAPPPPPAPPSARASRPRPSRPARRPSPGPEAPPPPPVSGPPPPVSGPPPPVSGPPPPVSGPPPPVSGPPPPEPPSAPLVEQPTHVSEEPELVEEFAEPGAEDGAGAQVTVDEPWEGYARLSAKDVIARVAVSSQAELAAVTLYESAHQARQTVLSAVERRLALASRGGISH